MGTLKRCNTLLLSVSSFCQDQGQITVNINHKIKLTDDQSRSDILLETCLKITVFGNEFIYFVIF